MSTNTKRIGKELLAFQKAGHQTLFLHALNDDMTNLRALIFGPPETPFEGSFLYFEILPIDYPNQPPKVKFLTPDTELCRMHPNLYASGKVCLSILGTWGKWEWSPLLTFEKILITIQGILDNNPLTNEPGFERLTLDDEKAREYAINSRWLVLKTVISMLGREDVPQPFREEMNKYFVRNFDSYVKSLKLLEEHEGKSYRTIHGEHIIKFKQLFQIFENKYKELTN